MNNFVYYVYINNCVYRLDLLSETVTKSLDFWINVHTGYHFFHGVFNSKPELLRCLNDMNQATANSYTRTFLIDPPYYVKQSWQPVTNILSTRITSYNMTYTFIEAEGGPTGCENGTEFEKFLNNFYAFCGPKTTLSISGNEIMFFGTSLFVSQLKNGKWYIKGDMEKICQLFGASTCAELRRFVDRTLGKKIRHGIFPECDSRDEIFKLLDKVKNV